jgi:AcrR family transcriptional regulator
MIANPPPGGLRERKKRQTRADILAAAGALFEARGYQHVTVAQIADAANVSVKTLFTYFRSKEDLAFADEYRLRDQLVEAIGARPAGTTPVQAVVGLLGRLVDEGGETGLEAYHRGYGDSDALASRLRRMWESYEDAVASVLAAEIDGPFAEPSARLAAAMLVAMVRSFTWSGILAEVHSQPSPQAGRETLRSWIAIAAPLISSLDQHLSARPAPQPDRHPSLTGTPA